MVVIAIDYAFRGSLGDYNVQFWVLDPANPSDRIYVDKFYTDTPTAYLPTVGDTIDVAGYYNPEAAYTDRTGYRPTVRSQFQCPPPNTGKLVITLTGTNVAAVPMDLQVSPGFGNAFGGTGKPNADKAANRIYIPGPLTLSNPNPAAFKRVSSVAGDNVYFGFEVSGGGFTGVLVNNYRTHGTTPTDGGAARCDYRANVNDGGSVTFINGIRGTWDTYTHASCVDGSTSCPTNSIARNPGAIPGTANDYTYVIYPADCTTDLVGN